MLMTGLAKDNIKAMNGVRRIYTITLNEVVYMYRDWAKIDNVTVAQHISDVAGLVKKKEEGNGTDWELDVRGLLSEYEEGCLEIKNIRVYYNRIVGKEVVPIGSIDNGHATILMDYELNYYVSLDNMLWSNGNGFNDFLRYQDGRKKYIRLK